MDWAANLYGLSKDFYNSANVGGGVIQVSETPRSFMFWKIDTLWR
jgi:hypothetical protein